MRQQARSSRGGAVSLEQERTPRPRLGRLIAAQAATALAAIIVAGLVGGAEAAAAAGLGAATGLVPQAWFAWRVLRHSVLAGDAAAMLRAMYLGETVKLAAIVVAFVGIFRWWPEIPPLPLLLAFVAVQVVHWFAPLLLQS